MTCQIDCILTTIILLIDFYPHMKTVLKNGDVGQESLYFIWKKCRQNKIDKAKFTFWLQHGLPLPEVIDFSVKLESEWILKPLKIKISQQISECNRYDQSCAFDKEDQEEYFQDSMRAFAKRCLKYNVQYDSFQDLFTAWSAEGVSCSKCYDGICNVTRSLDCGQGPPPLLPVPLFFETRKRDFPLPIQFDNQEQPQDISIGYHQYRLHAISYAVRNQTSGGKDYIHERSQIWNNRYNLWQVYDGEGWNADCSDKLKNDEDRTPGKSYRIAYFRSLM